jgi:hypothetical protein
VPERIVLTEAALAGIVDSSRAPMRSHRARFLAKDGRLIHRDYQMCVSGLLWRKCCKTSHLRAGLARACRVRATLALGDGWQGTWQADRSTGDGTPST